VVALKAYSVIARQTIRAQLTKGSKMSAIGHFVEAFGARKVKKKDAVAEYLAVERHFKAFYCFGLGKYFMKALHRGMRSNTGVLMFGTVKSRKVVFLNGHTLGLMAKDAAFLRNWSVAKGKYDKVFVSAIKKQQPARKAEKTSKRFANAGCKCANGAKKYSTCSKWFSYDKAAWCVVHPGCKLAIQSPKLGRWAFCT